MKGLLLPRYLLALLLTGALLVSCTTGTATKPTNPTNTPPPVKTGQPAAPIFNLADYRGQVVLLSFWSTWCPHCKAEIPVFNQIQNKYGSKGVVILGMVRDNDQPEAVMGRVKSLGAQFPSYAGYIPETLDTQFGGVPAYPTTFIIDRQGKVVKKVTGAADLDAWERHLAPLI